MFHLIISEGYQWKWSIQKKKKTVTHRKVIIGTKLDTEKKAIKTCKIINKIKITGEWAGDALRKLVVYRRSPGWNSKSAGHNHVQTWKMRNMIKCIRIDNLYSPIGVIPNN
jgi:hypothetical protein